MRSRLVYICDWLPPDYGAVGQYSDLFARQLARDGTDVTLFGLTTGPSSRSAEVIGAGSLVTIKLHSDCYDRKSLPKRLLWTAITNIRLIVCLWACLRKADEILFTGSPPLFLHFIAPANLLLRKRLIYRITDFHPECLMAASGRARYWLKPLYLLTLFWRRHVNAFEVLGEDQRQRLLEIGIPPAKIRLKRDPSPVAIQANTTLLPRPPGYSRKLLLLYSGNWGVAHDTATFIEAYRRHHRQGSGTFVLWLNAVGANAAAVESALREEGLPLIRSAPVPLDRLASLLVTPDAHLITLADPFVGFVLPSKVYGCIASQKPILFVGSAKSDVHLLCSAHAPAGYERAAAGDSTAVFEALERMAARIRPPGTRGSGVISVAEKVY